MINTIGLHIKVSNFKKSVAFYKSLGFKAIFEYGPGKAVEEDYNGIVFQHKEAKLELSDGHRAVKPEVFKQHIGSSKISVMIQVDDLSEIYRICIQKGITISVLPRHYYWGTLEMVIKDPDGVVLVFIAKYTADEAKKLKADEKFGVKPNK